MNLVGQIKKATAGGTHPVHADGRRCGCRDGAEVIPGGGVVRDLILERKNLDLDLVAEGDAIALAEELAKLKRGGYRSQPLQYGQNQMG